MTAPPTTEQTPPAHDEELRIGNFGWWAIGGALGTAITAVLAFIVLMNISAPDRITPEPAAGSAAAPAAEIELIATDFAFAPDTPYVEPGATLTMTNAGGVFHNLTIEGFEDFLLEADPGVSATGTIALDAGEYVIFCSIPGHRESGMEGTLVVVAE